MSETKCIKCGKEKDLKIYSFLTVKKSSGSNAPGEDAKTNDAETLPEKVSCAVCGDCMRKAQKNSISIEGPIVSAVRAFIVIVLAITVAHYIFKISVPAAVYLLALAVSLLVGFLRFRSAPRTKEPYAAASLKKEADMKENRNAGSLEYIPMDLPLYMDEKTGKPDLSVFSRMSGLKDEQAQTVFDLILAGANEPLEATEGKP